MFVAALAAAALASTQPNVDVITKSPRPPRAGKPYTATLHVVEGGEPVDNATIVARAIVRHRAVSLLRITFADSTARVVWRLPKSARNRYMTTTVTIYTAGGGIACTWIAIVR